MKKSNIKYFLIAALVTVGVVGVSMYSCEKEDIQPTTENLKSIDSDLSMAVPQNACGDVEEKLLYLESGREIGKSVIYNDGTNLYVIIMTNKGAYMDDAFLHVCETFDEIPLDAKGNPLLSSFNNKIIEKPLNNLRKFTIPLTQVKESSMISASVQIRTKARDAQTEGFEPKYQSAWIGGKTYGTSRKGKAFIFEKNICQIENTNPDVSAEDPAKERENPRVY